MRLKLYALALYYICYELSRYGNCEWVRCDAFFCKDTTPLDIFLSENLVISEELDYSKCNLCSFTVRNEVADSSPEDLLIATAVKQFANENFFARSIRTVKSRCRVVFICDKEALKRLPKERYEDVIKCGVQIIALPTKIWNGDYFSSATVGYYYVLPFLLRNRGRFRRVIYQDLFDSVFLGDPFTTDLINDHNEIHVTHEFRNGSFKYMVDYYHKAKLMQPLWYEKKYYKNSSHLGAFTETLIRFLLAFMSANDFNLGWNDQITANYMLYSGVLDKYGLHYSNEKRIERFINLISAMSPENTTWGNFHAYYHPNESYAVCLHHTWGNINIMVDIAKYCPIKERNKTRVNNYFGKCKAKCISAIMDYYHKLDDGLLR